MAKMSQTASGHPKHYHTNLFLVRVWMENLEGGNTEWRGQVKHVQSGEVRYFRNLVALVECFQAILPGIAESDVR